MKRIALLAATALLAPASAAHATTTVSNVAGTLRIDSVGKETNVVELWQAGSEMRVRDTASPITPGFGCQLITPEIVACPYAGVTDIHATLGEGDDTINVGRWTFKPSILDGGPGADSLTGGPQNDRLIGGTGPDELNGGVNGVDTADYSARTNNLGIYADNGIADDGEYGEGDNVRWDVENILGGSGRDVLWGNMLNNQLEGGPGNDVLQGFSGNDILTGGPDRDSYRGDDGDDLFISDFEPDGRDTFYGGYGIDQVDYWRRNDTVVVDNDGVADDGAPGELDNVDTDVERITGGWGDDTLTGDAADNELDGNGGNDALNGLGGNDRLIGGDDDDVLNGSTGDDTLLGNRWGDSLDGADTYSGGAGTDSASYAGRPIGVRVDEDNLADDGEPGERDNVKSDVETLIGSNGADTLSGGAAANWLHGGPGNDDLSGLGGLDWLYGEAGNDNLSGGAGDDRLRGGIGNDDLFGADGVQHNDSLDAEAGIDSCVGDRNDSLISCEDSPINGN